MRVTTRKNVCIVLSDSCRVIHSRAALCTFCYISLYRTNDNRAVFYCVDTFGILHFTITRLITFCPSRASIVARILWCYWSRGLSWGFRRGLTGSWCGTWCTWIDHRQTLEFKAFAIFIPKVIDPTIFTVVQISLHIDLKKVLQRRINVFVYRKRLVAIALARLQSRNLRR